MLEVEEARTVGFPEEGLQVDRTRRGIEHAQPPGEGVGAGVEKVVPGGSPGGGELGPEAGPDGRGRMSRNLLERVEGAATCERDQCGEAGERPANGSSSRAEGPHRPGF